MKRIFKRLMAGMLAALTVFTMPAATFAKKTTETGSVFVRARLDYTTASGMKAMSDKVVTLSSGKWKADGDYFYYDNPVEPGQTVDFISSVTIPEEWGNESLGKQFSILVTAEAAECLPGATGWNTNQEAAYTSTFDVMKGEQKELGYKVKKGSISLTIKEYELDESGKLKTYENNKVVVPGDEISKVVKITVNGNKTKRIKKEKNTEAEKPAEKSTETVVPGTTNNTSGGSSSGNWDGKVVKTGDNSMIELAAVGAMICLAGLIVVCTLIIRRRKKTS